MTMHAPLITAVYAAILGLLGALLTVRVIMNRVRLKVDVGDGGHAALTQAIRAHANFAEHVPLALLLIALAEAGGAWPLAIHILCAVLLLARLASAWGLSHSMAPTGGRTAGAGMTILIITTTSLLILFRTAFA
jgi:uncharacterized membrane protein YecN with MAPEG domain